MKKLLLALSVFTILPSIVLAKEAEIKGYKTMDSLGCMLLEECTDKVEQFHHWSQLVELYPAAWNTTNASSEEIEEVTELLEAFKIAGVKVYFAPGKYFPVRHRGVYHTVSNKFYLNRSYMDLPSVLLSVMRHEGWHAAQDCMAGTIDNSFIALIKPEDEVPAFWREMVERTYPAAAVVWEAEATWAGKTKGMTVDALEACSSGAMWDIYPPTPLTKKYLIDEGFIK
jgi:hypothetical protein